MYVQYVVPVGEEKNNGCVELNVKGCSYQTIPILPVRGIWFVKSDLIYLRGGGGVSRLYCDAAWEAVEAMTIHFEKSHHLQI
jgi:hypothetical protein